MSHQKINLGELLTAPVPQRDAIHVAVIAAVCVDWIPQPGSWVNLKPEYHGFAHPIVVTGEFVDHKSAIGIVDPFLTKPPKLNQKFLVILKPGTYTNLRHDWDHPLLAKTGDYPQAIPLSPQQELPMEPEPEPEPEDDGCSGCGV